MKEITRFRCILNAGKKETTGRSLWLSHGVSMRDYAYMICEKLKIGKMFSLFFLENHLWNSVKPHHHQLHRGALWQLHYFH
jgi:hypothetical protein